MTTPTEPRSVSEVDDMIATSITMAFGERCPNYSKGCPCCDAWKQYDDLRALQDERDGGWQDIATCAYRDDTEIFAWDGHWFDVVSFGWMDGDRPVWFNGDVPFDAIAWRPLPSPPHTFTPDQITENLNERHEAGERA